MAFRPELKHIMEAAKGSGNTGLGKDIIEGKVFYRAKDEDLLLSDLKTDLTDSTKRNQILNVLEGNTNRPLPIQKIITTFFHYSEIVHNPNIQLSKKDLELLSFTVKYLEEWFYRGNWVRFPETHKVPDNHSFYSAPATLLNALTKFKERQTAETKFASLDPARLRDFIHRVNQFGQQNISDKGAVNIFNQSRSNVEREINLGHTAADFYLLKNCIIAADIQRREADSTKPHIFKPDTHFLTPQNEYLNYDFSSGKFRGGQQSMHVATHRLPFSKVAVEYLRNNH